MAGVKSVFRMSVILGEWVEKAKKSVPLFRRHDSGTKHFAQFARFWAGQDWKESKGMPHHLKIAFFLRLLFLSFEQGFSFLP